MNLSLRSKAEAAAAPFPPLLADAERLANTVLIGDHGRRRAGIGDAFWQYRPAQDHDSARMIDWRRSARSDQTFVQDKEWQIAQTVMFWINTSASMRFASDDDLPNKADRARLLGLATAILLNRGGEKVGLAGGHLPARRGSAQLERLAATLADDDKQDYGAPTIAGLPMQGRAVFISDFLGDISIVEETLAKAAEIGVTGALCQVLDPQEEQFPFDGRTIFESIGGTLAHETLKARDLRSRYLDRLATRKARLKDLARSTGWHYATHRTNQSASHALLWLYHSLERVI